MKLTAIDFQQLTVNSTNWAGTLKAWKKQESRFETLDGLVELDYTFYRAYWVEGYPSVLFAKAFLEALNFEYKVLFDTADSLYVITTNYGGEIK
jgi:hypothetical protein